MNIFALSYCPDESARWQHDKHVVKMVLETAQMLATNASLVPEWNEHCSGVKLYAPAYVNHPCTIWARQSLGNFRWLCLHGQSLYREYDYRFGGPHKSYEQVIKPLLDLSFNSFDFGSLKMTPFAVAMPDEYKVPGNAVQSYRNYYVAEKLSSNPKWTGRCRVTDLPSWLSGPALSCNTHS